MKQSRSREPPPLIDKQSQTRSKTPCFALIPIAISSLQEILPADPHAVLAHPHRTPISLLTTSLLALISPIYIRLMPSAMALPMIPEPCFQALRIPPGPRLRLLLLVHLLHHQRLRLPNNQRAFANLSFLGCGRVTATDPKYLFPSTLLLRDGWGRNDLGAIGIKSHRRSACYRPRRRRRSRRRRRYRRGGRYRRRRRYRRRWRSRRWWRWRWDGYGCWFGEVVTLSRLGIGGVC